MWGKWLWHGHTATLISFFYAIMWRSGTEEEYGELSQLLEDIYSYREDLQEQKSKEKESKKKREEEDKQKGEKMRAAALSGITSKFNLILGMWRWVSCEFYCLNVWNFTLSRIVTVSNVYFLFLERKQSSGESSDDDTDFNLSAGSNKVKGTVQQKLCRLVILYCHYLYALGKSSPHSHWWHTQIIEHMCIYCPWQ